MNITLFMYPFPRTTNRVPRLDAHNRERYFNSLTGITFNDINVDKNNIMSLSVVVDVSGQPVTFKIENYNYLKLDDNGVITYYYIDSVSYINVTTWQLTCTNDVYMNYYITLRESIKGIIGKTHDHDNLLLGTNSILNSIDVMGEGVTNDIIDMRYQSLSVDFTNYYNNAKPLWMYMFLKPNPIINTPASFKFRDLDTKHIVLCCPVNSNLPFYLNDGTTQYQWNIDQLFGIIGNTGQLNLGSGEVIDLTDVMRANTLNPSIVAGVTYNVDASPYITSIRVVSTPPFNLSSINDEGRGTYWDINSADNGLIVYTNIAQTQGVYSQTFSDFLLQSNYSIDSVADSGTYTTFVDTAVTGTAAEVTAFWNALGNNILASGLRRFSTNTLSDLNNVNFIGGGSIFYGATTLANGTFINNMRPADGFNLPILNNSGTNTGEQIIGVYTVPGIQNISPFISQYNAIGSFMNINRSTANGGVIIFNGTCFTLRTLTRITLFNIQGSNVSQLHVATFIIGKPIPDATMDNITVTPSLGNVTSMLTSTNINTTVDINNSDSLFFYNNLLTPVSLNTNTVDYSFSSLTLGDYTAAVLNTQPSSVVLNVTIDMLSGRDLAPDLNMYYVKSYENLTIPLRPYDINNGFVTLIINNAITNDNMHSTVDVYLGNSSIKPLLNINLGNNYESSINDTTAVLVDSLSYFYANNANFHLSNELDRQTQKANFNRTLGMEKIRATTDLARGITSTGGGGGLVTGSLSRAFNTGVNAGVNMAEIMVKRDNFNESYENLINQEKLKINSINAKPDEIVNSPTGLIQSMLKFNNKHFWIERHTATPINRRKIYEHFNEFGYPFNLISYAHLHDSDYIKMKILEPLNLPDYIMGRIDDLLLAGIKRVPVFWEEEVGTPPPF